MTAEGLRLSLACPHGDRVSESKRGWRGVGGGGIYAVPSSPGPVMVVGAGLHRWQWETDIDKN